MYFEKQKGIVFYSITTILTFFIIYQSNLSFLGLPPELHSNRVASMLLVLYAVLKYKVYWPVEFTKKTKVGRNFSKIVRLYLYFLVYSFLLYIFQGPGSGMHSFIALVNLFIITIPIIWAYSVIFDDIDSFMRVLLYVGVLQSVVIIIGQINPSFILFLDVTFNHKTDVNSDFLFTDLINNYAGGIGCITSQGAIRFVSGLIASSYLYIKFDKIKYLLIFLIFAIVSSMIARTGLILDLVCFVFILLTKMQKRNIVNIIGFLCFLGISVLLFYNTIDNNTSFWEDRFKRYDTLREDKGEVFFNDYFRGERTDFPSIEENLFIGVGTFSGRSAGGSIVNVDGGFLRTYSAFGLFPALLFYMVLFVVFYSLFKSQQNRLNRILILMIIISLLVGEFKEFFFMTYWPMTFLIVTSVLISKSKRVIIEKF